MSNEERQRILREAGSAPAEAEKAEGAKSSREAATKDAAAEASQAAGAREPDADAPPEPADAKVKRRAGRARRARREAEREQAGEPATTPEEAAEDQRAEEAEQEAAENEPDEAAGPARRAPGRRRAAETSTTPPAAPKRSPDGAVAVRAQARYVHCAPRKARLVIQHIRGKSVDEARAILRNTPRGASRDVLKLLESCVANAENNHELAADELKVGQAVVDEGPTIKRYRPRALGRATRIRKRTSHMTITLTPKE